MSQQTIWTELTSYLQSEFRHPWRFPWKVDACAIDTGGTYTKNVYAYTYSRPIRNIFGIKGKSVSGQSWLERSDKVRGLYVVATDVIKRGIYDNLSIVAPAPGYCHIPAGRDYTWSEQLVSEVPIARKVNNTIVMRFDLPKGRRNEALDCRVLARTALEILRPNWRGLEKVFEARRAAAVQTTSAEYVPGPERLQQDPVITQRPTPPAPKPHQPQRRFRRPSFWVRVGLQELMVASDIPLNHEYEVQLTRYLAKRRRSAPGNGGESGGQFDASRSIACAEMFTNLGATAQAEEDAFAKMPQRPPGPVRRFVVRGFDWWTRFCESKEEPQ